MNEREFAEYALAPAFQVFIEPEEFLGRMAAERTVVDEVSIDGVLGDFSLHGMPVPMLQAVKEVHTMVGECHCDHCGRKIYGVKDDLSLPWAYFGQQVSRPRSYRYSPVVTAMRRILGVEGVVWPDPPLLNSHTRVHVSPPSYDTQLKGRDALRLLCNGCFRKTYRRVMVHGDDGVEYSISVVEEWGETIQSVMNELGVHGTVGKAGAIHEY